jgi:hypothetical protein
VRSLLPDSTLELECDGFVSVDQFTEALRRQRARELILLRATAAELRRQMLVHLLQLADAPPAGDVQNLV